MIKIKYILLLALCLASCAGHDSDKADENTPATEVTLTHACFGNIGQKIVLTATSAYQNKITVAASVASFVMDTQVKPGMKIKKGALLYELESKEQHALGKHGMTMRITAESDGVILDVQAHTGSYVPEGSVLCTIVETGSLVFEINVPYEQSEQIRNCTRCILELPNGRHISAALHSTLATMNVDSQTEKIVAIADAPFIPEGMNVKAFFVFDNLSKDVMLLPKSAVQSDEMLAEYWVMKLTDNKIAIKVPVMIGNSTADSIEIVSAGITPQDDIIQTGGYGLAEGAKVVVVH